MNIYMVIRDIRAIRVILEGHFYHNTQEMSSRVIRAIRAIKVINVIRVIRVIIPQ